MLDRFECLHRVRVGGLEVDLSGGGVALSATG